MIPLEHEVWRRLSCHSLKGVEFARLLNRYYQGLVPEEEDLVEDLLECICGGQIYDSSYAAAPHLVELASRAASPIAAVVMLGFAAQAYAECDQADSPPIDPLLEPDLRALGGVALPVARKVWQQLDPGSEEYAEHEATVLAFEGKLEEYQELKRKLMNQACEKPTPIQNSSASLPSTSHTGSQSKRQGTSYTGSQQERLA